MNHIFLLEDEAFKDAGYDNPPRTQILKILHKQRVTIATDPAQAKILYDPQEGYSHLLLDHDMEGWPNPDLKYHNTGLNFVQWLVKFKIPVPCPEVIIHTQNKAGREAMAKLLKATGYKKINLIPYGSAYLNHLSERFS